MARISHAVIEAAFREPGATPKSVAAKLGIGVSTAYKYRPGSSAGRVSSIDVPALDGQDRSLAMNERQLQRLAARLPEADADVDPDGSLMYRVMRRIAEHGGYESSVRLAADLWDMDVKDDPTHTRVCAAIEKLNVSGCLTHKEGTGLLTEIKPTDPKGYDAAGIPVPSKQMENPSGGRLAGWSRQRHAVGKDLTEPRYHRGQTEGGEIIKETLAEHRLRFPDHLHDDSEAASAPTRPRTWDYPALDALRVRATEQARNADRAERLLQAAALIEDIDPDQSERLFAQAEAIGVEPFTALELEYLRFAEDHN